jgi:NAD+ synthase (glutamine-hydrolysing)
MIIALAQMDVKPGRPGENVKNMIRMINEARSNGAEIIAFPEHCVGGYFVGGPLA